MAIKGSLQEASLPDVIQLLSLGRKTGMLSLTDRHNFGSVYFEQGRITYAQIVNRRDRLGDTLVKEGRISQQQLDLAIDSQKEDREKRLGEILVEQGALGREDLERYMTLQIEESVFFLFTWTSGSFHFETDVRPDADAFLVSINPESLLLEGARRVDEWALIEKKIPSFDLVFTVDGERLDAAAEDLTQEQKQLIDHIDGRKNVTALIEETAMPEFDVGKALYGLITAGLVHRSRSQPQRRRTSGTAQVDEHRNLGIAFYRTGMFDESHREFRRVVELEPDSGSTFFHLGLIALRQARWSDAEEYLSRASELLGERQNVLINLALALEKNGSGSRAEEVFEQAVACDRQSFKPMLGWGVAAMKRGEHEVACGRLDRARELLGESKPPAVWYWARSLAAGCLQDFDDARSLLEEGIESYPGNVVLKNNLSVILELSGEVERAEELLQEAVASEPSVPQLHKNIGDIAYRVGQFDEAWDAYNLALKYMPDLGDDAYFKLGNIAYKRSDARTAADFWEKTLEINPGHELARTNLDTIEALG